MRFPDDVPVLTDGVVTLRPHSRDDIPAVLRLGQDSEMQRWTTVPVPYERRHAEHFVTEHVPAGWRDGGRRAWAIEYDGRFAGTVDLRDGVGGVGELGFGVGPWARGRGVTTRAVRLAVGHAFDGFGWDRVVWQATIGNWASRRVAWKCGFRGFVTLPGAGLCRGVRQDKWFASLGRDDDRAPYGRWWQVPVLSGAGLRLRPFRAGDARRTAEACADAETQYWLSGLPDPYLLSHAEVFLASRQERAAVGECVSWVVADPASDELLANVSIFHLDDPVDPTSGEIGYWAHPDARGRGVMTAAVGHVVRHAFTPIADGGLGRRRLVILAADGNIPSARVAIANGFTVTGTARAASPRRDGGYDDLRCYDRLITD